MHGRGPSARDLREAAQQSDPGHPVLQGVTAEPVIPGDRGQVRRADPDEQEGYFGLYGGRDPLAECEAGSLYLRARRAGGRIRRGRADHGRERHR